MKMQYIGEFQLFIETSFSENANQKLIENKLTQNNFTKSNTNLSYESEKH